MKNRIVIIYDSPLKYCEKIWMKEELVKRGYKVIAIGSFWRISNIEQRGKLGKLAARILTLWQSLKGMIRSRRQDVVICWSQWSGLFFNMIPGADKRNIISYNWLTPVPNEKTRFLYAKALQNEKLWAIINCPKTEEDIKQAYKVKGKSNIAYIPDVFNDKECFQSPHYVTKNRYCFSGGRANRDWNLLMELARKCPYIDFRIVAAGSDWNKNIEIPVNVTVYFDLKPEQYYELLENAYMAVYPLKEDRVSGLINILKSMQKGKIVLTTDMPFTEIYFPKDCRNFLLPFGDSEAWKKEVDMVWNYDCEEYGCLVGKMQKYVQTTFSPKKAIEELEKIITGFYGGR